MCPLYRQRRLSADLGKPLMTLPRFHVHQPLHFEAGFDADR